MHAAASCCSVQCSVCWLVLRCAGWAVCHSLEPHKAAHGTSHLGSAAALLLAPVTALPWVRRQRFFLRTRIPHLCIATPPFVIDSVWQGLASIPAAAANLTAVLGWLEAFSSWTFPINFTGFTLAPLYLVQPASRACCPPKHLYLFYACHAASVMMMFVSSHVLPCCGAISFSRVRAVGRTVGVLNAAHVRLVLLV